MQILIFTILFLGMKEVPLKPVLTLAPPSHDLFLEKPADIVIGPTGRIFVADAGARVVYYWDANGTYLGHIGQSGAGPGEFSFLTMAGPQAKMGISGDSLFVFDGALRRISHFSLKSMAYIESVKMDSLTGKIQMFEVTNDGEYLVSSMDFMKENPERTISLFASDGKHIKTIFSTPDKSFVRTIKNNRMVTVTIFGYGSALVSAYSQYNDKIFVGLSDSQTLSIYESKGGLIKTIPLPLIPRKVTDAEKEEFRDLPFLKGNGMFKIVFPENRCLYDHILPAQDGQFLLFQRSALYANITGFILDGEGKAILRFSYHAGEGGNLYGTKGRIFAFTNQENGDWVIHELDMKP